jgi:phosphatidylinositol alpha-1,6-mannosyltransferase
LFVGGVKPRKGVVELVRAFARVRERLPLARLWIVGALTIDSAYVNAVRGEIDHLGLGECVELRGRLSDDALLPLYGQAWAFALPARTIDGSFEGFGLALLEASAAGLPVVSTRGGGTSDAVRDGETGLLVGQDDPDALAEALLRVLSDPALAARLGAAGRAYAASQTWDGVAGQVIECYRAS